MNPAAGGGDDFALYQSSVIASSLPACSLWARPFLAGAIRISPDSNVAEALARINPHRTVVVYCSVGYRSSQLARRLQRAGFTNVMNLEGSIFAWANEGRPLVANGHSATLVHPYNRKFGRMLKPSLRAPLK